MAKNRGVDTTPNGKGGWKNSTGGQTTSQHRTQAAAIEAGKSLAKAQQAEHRIHGRNGQIREANSYGNDEFPPRG